MSNKDIQAPPKSEASRKFVKAIRQILSVPKDELARREATYQKERAAKKALRKAAKLSPLLLLALIFELAACATVPLASEQQTLSAMKFQPPANEASLYVYRKSGYVGSGEVYPVYVDGRILGNTGPGTFLFTNVPPGAHIISSGISQATVNAVESPIYFVQQTASMGTINGTVHKTSVQLVSEVEGKEAIASCKQASSNF